jgi:hypothetical protein
MMYRTAQSQSQHDQIVQAMVNYLARQGFQNIRADLPGYAQPSLVKGTNRDHIPDVTANGVIIEVETDETINIDHTTSQWQLFADHAAKSGQSFWVAVPRGSAAAALQRLSELGLRAGVYEA